MNRNTTYLKPRNQIYAYNNNILIIKEIKVIVQRLYLQTYRRPSSLLISLIQPLLWLILFGALFQNAPIYLFEGYNIQYKEFLNSGILVFTAFNSSINSGLPIVFDREFGFINRILTCPITNKKSVVYSCIIHTLLIANIQVFIIIIFNSCQLKQINTYSQLMIIFTISTIITSSISSLSIYSAFVLPGHIEFIALSVLFINLPTLFASTALAPLTFMPYWLQVLVCMNPLTYAIEIIRQSQLNNFISMNTKIINTVWFQAEVKESITILIMINLIGFICINRIIKYKYD